MCEDIGNNLSRYEAKVTQNVLPISHVYAHSMRFPSRNNLAVDTLTDATPRCYAVAGCRGLVSDCQTALIGDRGGQIAGAMGTHQPLEASGSGKTST